MRVEMIRVRCVVWHAALLVLPERNKKYALCGHRGAVFVHSMAPFTSTQSAEVGCYGRSDASNTTATHNFAAASPTSRGSAAASVPTYLGYIHGG